MSIAATKPDLAVLVSAAKLGDRVALEQLVELAQDRLYRFCFYLTGRPERAEDLLQDTLVRVLGALAQLEKPQDFFSWTFRIARNVFIDQSRGQKNQAHDEFEEGSQAWDESSGLSFQAVEAQMQIREGFKDFSAEDKWILLLVDLEEYSYLEAAELVGISESALKTRVFRLRKAFAAKLKGS